MRKPTLALSKRQGQVLALVHAGLGDKQIAAELGMSIATARAHLRLLSLKLGVRGRVSLALWWERRHHPS